MLWKVGSYAVSKHTWVYGSGCNFCLACRPQASDKYMVLGNPSIVWGYCVHHQGGLVALQYFLVLHQPTLAKRSYCQFRRGICDGQHVSQVAGRCVNTPETALPHVTVLASEARNVSDHILFWPVSRKRGHLSVEMDMRWWEVSLLWLAAFSGCLGAWEQTETARAYDIVADATWRNKLRKDKS